MDYHPFTAKPLLKPSLTYIQLHFQELTSMKCASRYIYLFRKIKCKKSSAKCRSVFSGLNVTALHIGWCKESVTLMQMLWIYVPFALTNRHISVVCFMWHKYNVCFLWLRCLLGDEAWNVETIICVLMMKIFLMLFIIILLPAKGQTGFSVYLRKDRACRTGGHYCD